MSAVREFASSFPKSSTIRGYVGRALLASLLALATSTVASAQIAIAPDGTRVVFFQDQDADFVNELYSAPIDGSEAPLMLAQAPGAGVMFYAYAVISPDSSMVLYFAQEEGVGGERVHRVPIDGSAAPFVYDFPGPGISGGDTDPFFKVGPLGHVVYWHESYALYSAPLEGGAVTLLSGDATYVSHWICDPTGPGVVFRSNSDFPGLELFGNDMDEGTAPIPLRGAIDSGTMGFFEISSDGSRVAYTADQDSPGVVELYSVPSNASAAPIKLSPPIVAGGTIFADFLITPDGARVVYRGDQDVDNVNELYSVPLDGSAAAVQLNGTLVAGGNVSQGFQISTDGSRVVYLADQQTNEVFELFSRPTGGAGSSVRLNGALAPGGDVTGFQISTDGSRVVFRADKDVNDVFELFSVAIEGRGGRKLAQPSVPGQAPLVQLNPPLVTGGDVIDWKISADGAWTVYRADQDVDGVIALCSVPTYGGVAIQLNGSTSSFYEIGGDRVVFTDAGALFSVPLDGSTPPVQLTL